MARFHIKIIFACSIMRILRGPDEVGFWSSLHLKYRYYYLNEYFVHMYILISGKFCIQNYTHAYIKLKLHQGQPTLSTQEPLKILRFLDLGTPFLGLKSSIFSCTSLTNCKNCPFPRTPLWNFPASLFPTQFNV